ncbi:MAG: hypothetical protein J2P28_01105 [Actinobacteria bacterium]|nr:hypothetical protein [Actinomycetota bacterium]
MTAEDAAALINWQDDDGIVPLYDRHDELISELANRDYFWTEQAAAADSPESRWLIHGWRAQIEIDLRDVRARMRKLGLTPPTLPDDLAYVDKERSEP